jgi:alkylated DNA nucleotide flippase Atl1
VTAAALARQSQDNWYAGLFDDAADDIFGFRQGQPDRPALEPPSQRRLDPPDHWRNMLTMARLARDVAAYAGEREAARQVGYALSSTDAILFHDVLLVIASQRAKNVPMPRVRDIENHLRDLGDKLRTVTQRVTRHQTPRRPGAGRRDPLPVETARAVPILDLLARYGITARQVGREYLSRCPFGDHRCPHLYVNPRKGVWKCWPCDLGGDGIAFVMRLKGLDFAAAVREVAA